MSYFEENIAVLSINPNSHIGEFIPENIVYQLVSSEGNKEIFQYGNQLISIEDRFEESQKPNSLKRELIFVIGLNSIKEINEISSQMNKDSIMVVIEPESSFFVHVLEHKDLAIFENQNVLLFTDQLKELNGFLEELFSGNPIYYIKNIKFYLTDFYRNNLQNTSVEVVRKVKEMVKYKTTLYGNSVEDSLLGLKQNFLNMDHLEESIDVSKIKDKFKDIPSIVVAAGPSLNKNIQLLKKIARKVIIIAVDTIVQRLLAEGITPHFVCSVERGKETYTYFYENKYIPEETILVGPLLLYPNIFDEYKGRMLIPLRENVAEYKWLSQVLSFNSEYFVPMGLSCAHMAFGLAEHIGSSPIILIGQDLAFGSTETESHASGTIYDSKDGNDGLKVKNDYIETEGYFDGMVSTTNIWMSFKHWFENEIRKKDLFVIDATEGGAKIEGTKQFSLEDVSNKYLHKDVTIVKESIESIPNISLTSRQMISSFEKEKEQIGKILKDFLAQKKVLETLILKNTNSESLLLKYHKVLQTTDKLFLEVTKHDLLRHNLQAAVMSCIWNLYDIDQVLSITTIRQNKKVQLEYLEVSILVMSTIISYMDKLLDNLKK